jgi:proteic killer suppression protein
MPGFVARKLATWVTAVETSGLHVVQTYPGFNDEKLSGARQGQHSIRLNQAYRAFYTVSEDGEITVTVIEVNKHEY